MNNTTNKRLIGLLYIDKTNIIIYLNEFNNLYTEIIVNLLIYKEVISRSNYKLQNKVISNKV